MTQSIRANHEEIFSHLEKLVGEEAVHAAMLIVQVAKTWAGGLTDESEFLHTGKINVKRTARSFGRASARRCYLQGGMA